MRCMQSLNILNLKLLKLKTELRFQTETDKMTKIEKVYYENGIKITRIPEKKRKNKTVIETKFHQKAKRSNNGNGPSTKVISGIYGNNTQKNGKDQHRGFNPLAAQQNQAREQY